MTDNCKYRFLLHELRRVEVITHVFAECRKCKVPVYIRCTDFAHVAIEDEIIPFRAETDCVSSQLR